MSFRVELFAQVVKGGRGGESESVADKMYGQWPQLDSRTKQDVVPNRTFGCNPNMAKANHSNYRFSPTQFASKLYRQKLKDMPG